MNTLRRHHRIAVFPLSLPATSPLEATKYFHAGNQFGAAALEHNLQIVLCTGAITPFGNGLITSEVSFDVVLEGVEQNDFSAAKQILESVDAVIVFPGFFSFANQSHSEFFLYWFYNFQDRQPFCFVNYDGMLDEMFEESPKHLSLPLEQIRGAVLTADHPAGALNITHKRIAAWWSR